MSAMVCPLCKCDQNREEFSPVNTHGREVCDAGEEFMLRLCVNCQAYFLSDIALDAGYYQKYYQKKYYESSFSQSFFVRLFDGIVFAWKKAQILRVLGKRFGKRCQYTVLDIGAGSGEFVSRLDSGRFLPYALEIHPDGVALLRQKGIQVYDKPLERCDFEGKKFHMITYWHVLEHISDPVSQLTMATELLAPNGILVVALPNPEGLGFRYGKKHWFHLDAPRHLWHGGPEAIKRMAQQCGLRLLKIAYPVLDYPLDLFWSVRHSYLRFLVWPLYPIFKIFSHETAIYWMEKR